MQKEGMLKKWSRRVISMPIGHQQIAQCRWQRHHNLLALALDSLPITQLELDNGELVDLE
jgi:hypothetical protein